MMYHVRNHADLDVILMRTILLPIFLSPHFAGGGPEEDVTRALLPATGRRFHGIPLNPVNILMSF